MHSKIINDLKLNSQLIENALNEYYNEGIDELSMLIPAQRYAILSGGKRIRAFLVMQVCRLLGGNEKAALPYACALEMIHTSSLIHDDMPCMDNDDYRRGKPATHKEFGEAIALLSGDAMMVKAFEVAIKNDFLPAEYNARAVEALADGAGEHGMLEGQGTDTYYLDKCISFEELLRLHAFKTGKLIIAGVKLGCIAARINSNDFREAAVIKYAKNVGLAFQIVDDILDYQEGKREPNSFMSFLSVEEAKKYVDELTHDAICAIESFDDGTLKELALFLTVRES